MRSNNNKLLLPAWAERLQPSALQTLLAYGSDETFISFAHGLPAMELFPKKIYREVVNELIEVDQYAFQYTPPLEELKSHIVKLMSLRGVHCQEKQILLTAGGQQGINLLVRLLLENHGKIILEELAYPGILQAIEPYQPEIFTVATHPDTGMDIDHVEDIIQSGQRIAFIYLVSEGGNPRATSLAKENRKRLAALAEKFGVPVIEDDPYGFLSYGNQQPALKHYQDEWIFYVGSFSKIFAPSLRTGWLVVPEWLTARLGSLKESMDINTATFSQRTVNALLNKNIFSNHMQLVCEAYRKRRDALVDALEQYFPKNINFHIPDHGIFMWLDLPHEINTTQLLVKSIAEEKVAFIPSEAFQATQAVNIKNGIRLNFSHPTVEKINEGMQRLARVLAAESMQLSSYSSACYTDAV